MIRRGEIYWVQLDPAIGSEIKKTRPALVISNNQNNEFAQTVTLLPITSNVKKIYPFEVFLPKGEGGVDKEGKIKTDQVRTVDKRRLAGPPLGPTVNAEIIGNVEKALKLHLGL